MLLTLILFFKNKNFKWVLFFFLNDHVVVSEQKKNVGIGLVYVYHRKSKRLLVWSIL